MKKIKGIKKSYSEWLHRGGGFNVQLFYDATAAEVYALTTYNGWQVPRDSDAAELEPPYPGTVGNYSDFKAYILNAVTNSDFFGVPDWAKGVDVADIDKAFKK